MSRDRDSLKRVGCDSMHGCRPSPLPAGAMLATVANMESAIVTFTVRMVPVFVRVGDWWVGRFPQIDVESQGRTREEAARNLVEATQLFIETCFEQNMLDEVLKACGFVPGHPSDPVEGDYLTVPVELLAARNGPASIAR